MSDPRRPGRGPPTDTDDLEELEDDAILAQQSVTHAPQPRAHVAIEQRSVVVLDLPAEIDPSEVMATRQLSAMPGSRDPTMLIRRPAPAQPKPTNWLVLSIWIVAGLLAFAFGGLLALLSARGSGTGTVETPAVLPSP